MKYVPIIGFVYCAAKILWAQHLYDVCHAGGGSCWAEYDATWPLFDDVTIAFLVTMLFAVFMFALIQYIQDRSHES